MSENQQKLVLAIIDFLSDSLKDVKSDDKEGLEVAIQCIGEAFGVDPSDNEQIKKLSVKPTNLQNIFDVFLKTKAKVSTPSGQASASSASGSTEKGPSASDKAEAEKLKASGNTFMTSKKYAKAIDLYTQAIALDGTNPVYYSNRAAAHTSNGDHLSAIGDSEQALALDSKFVKAYHRLGHAHYCLGDYSAAAKAFERGLAIDSSNANLKSGLENAKARINTEDSDDDGPPPLADSEEAGPSSSPAPRAGGAGGMPDLASMASMFGGAGGGGGMPDIGSMMNNPAMMAAAQQMAANGGFEKLMSNPAVMNMMNRVQSGGGMPDMAELMADPEMRNIASQFMGGGGGSR